MPWRRNINGGRPSVPRQAQHHRQCWRTQQSVLDGATAEDHPCRKTSAGGRQPVPRNITRRKTLRANVAKQQTADRQIEIPCSDESDPLPFRRKVLRVDEDERTVLGTLLWRLGVFRGFFSSGFSLGETQLSFSSLRCFASLERRSWMFRSSQALGSNRSARSPLLTKVNQKDSSIRPIEDNRHSQRLTAARDAEKICFRTLP